MEGRACYDCVSVRTVCGNIITHSPNDVVHERRDGTVIVRYELRVFAWQLDSGRENTTEDVIFGGVLWGRGRKSGCRGGGRWAYLYTSNIKHAQVHQRNTIV